jgi:hypothetical protein
MFEFLSFHTIGVIVAVFYLLVGISLCLIDHQMKTGKPIQKFMRTLDSILVAWPLLLFVGLIVGLVEISSWTYRGLCWCGGVQRPHEIRVG